MQQSSAHCIANLTEKSVYRSEVLLPRRCENKKLEMATAGRQDEEAAAKAAVVEVESVEEVRIYHLAQ